MNELSSFEAKTVIIAVRKMLGGSHFSICDLDKIMEITGNQDKKGSPEYNCLSALHCVNWADMGADLASQAKEECLRILNLPDATIEGEFKRSDEDQKQGGKVTRMAFWK